MLDELTAFCTQPKYVYSHHWREGDAVMWDNRCTLHRATMFDKRRYKRKLHRTTIAGKAPDSAFASVPEPRDVQEGPSEVRRRAAESRIGVLPGYSRT